MEIILTAEALDAAVQYLCTAEFVVFDVESQGDHRGDPWRNEVSWISLSDGHQTYVIPMGFPNGELLDIKYPLTGVGERRLAEGKPLRASDYSKDIRKATKVWGEPPQQLSKSEVFDALKPIMFGDIRLVGHNLSFDLGSVAKYYGDQIPTGPYGDTMIAAFLVDSSRKGQYGLAQVAKRYAGIDLEKGVGENVLEHDFDTVAKYSGLDAYATAMAWRALEPMIPRDSLGNTNRLEMDVLPIVVDMNLAGCLIDTTALRAFKDRLEADIEKTVQEIRRLSRPGFNMNSNADKQAQLFGPKPQGLGLRCYKYTPKGQELKDAGQDVDIKYFSVDRESLEFHEAVPLVKALLTYADQQKMLSTYVIAYLGGEVTRTTNGKARIEVREPLLDNGYLHTSFNQIGAETGRFSSRNPNLQNVPNPNSEYGKFIRSVFIAPEGHKFVVADFSQIEPRVIASFSGDPVMLDAYRTGKDLYLTIAGRLGVTRDVGKEQLLSQAYGVGPAKVAGKLGISIRDAKQLKEDFDREFKAVAALKRKVVRDASQQRPVPYVTTITGRRRYIPQLRSQVDGIRMSGERKAFNTLIQGSAADIMKIALVRANQLIPNEARILLTIHDELVTVTPEHLAEKTAEAIREAMEGINLLTIPLKADVVIADNWGAGHK